ncbi:MAG: extracellular solute-binding protein [Treponema sp.]|jgi:lactose/L-arabinose transport system substrate-binding protein|nr:extracellular solute-binding protein [Treponema sp.]
MKKICIIGAAALLGAALLLAGCSKKAETTAAPAAADPNAPVTITVWCWDPQFNIFAMNEAAKVYNRERPNVTINVVETPWNDLQQKLITALSARQTASLPDIVLMQDNAMQKNILTYPDAFYPVDGKVDTSQFAQYKVGVGVNSGKTYVVPFDNGVTGTFIRRDIVEQAGLQVSDFNDITWERFIELGKIVKAKTGIPLVSADASSMDFIWIMLQSAGTWVFDDQGKAYIKDNAVLRKSIEVISEMISSEILLLVQDWNAYIATLNNGTVASTIQGCWIIGSISAEASQAGKWALVNTPRLSIGNSVNYSSQGGSGWMVLSSSKNPDVAVDFLNKTFAGSVEFYGTILPPSGAIGTWLPAAQAPVYGAPSEYFGGQKVYEDLITYAGKVPEIKYGIFNYEARDAVTRALMEIMQGASIDTALDTAQKNVEFIMAQ